MATLAIKGHETRSEEIIKLLEMLGGHNDANLFGYKSDLGYFITDSRDIACRDINYILSYFTLEEFLEKYPYKVGDQVIAYAEGVLASFSIKGMRWNNKLNKVEYKICSSWYDVSMISAIQPYTDYDIKTNKDMEEKDKAKAPDLKGEDYSGKRFGYKIPDGYEFDTVYNGNIILKPIKPQYPKTYEECCNILGIEDRENGYCGYEYELLGKFQKLYICRNAYWKIAGKEMGLDKPWAYDMSKDEFSCAISYEYGSIQKCEVRYRNHFLVFPTSEMRDAFYENFKKEIEQCKELL